MLYTIIITKYGAFNKDKYRLYKFGAINNW